jgi:hypothetical protein
MKYLFYKPKEAIVKNLELLAFLKKKKKKKRSQKGIELCAVLRKVY